MKNSKTKFLYAIGIALIIMQGFTFKTADKKLVLFSASGFVEGVTMRSADISGLEKVTKDGKDGGIKFRTESNDARLVLQHFPIDAGKYKSIHVRFSKRPFQRFETLYFYFITDVDKNYGKDKGNFVPIVDKADEAVINLELIPTWKGKIIGTRINFGQVKGSEVIVEEIYYSTDPAPTPVK